MPLAHDRMKDDPLSRALASIKLREYIETATNQVARHEGKGVYVLPVCPICGGGAHLKAGDSAFITFAGCAQSGTLIDYLIAKDGLSTGEAIKQVFRLAKTKSYDTNIQTPSNTQRVTASAIPIRYNFASFVKNAHEVVEQTNYFKNRGLSKTTIDKFKLGFSRDGLNSLEGLPVHSDKRHFRKRYKYIFPFLTVEGETNYVQTRLDPKELNDWEQENLTLPKAYNLPGLSIPLYNEYRLGENHRILFVVEGPYDALSIEEIGYPAIALCGVSNLKKLINAINTRNIAVTKTTLILIPDNDTAGTILKDKFIAAMKEIKIDYDVLGIEKQYKDANDLLIQDKDRLLELVTQKSNEVGGTDNDYQIQ